MSNSENNPNFRKEDNPTNTNRDGQGVNAGNQSQNDPQSNWNQDHKDLNKKESGNYGAGSEHISSQNYGAGSTGKSSNDTSNAGYNSSSATTGQQPGMENSAEKSGYTQKVTPEVPGREEPHKTETPKAQDSSGQRSSEQNSSKGNDSSSTPH